MKSHISNRFLFILIVISTAQFYQSYGNSINIDIEHANFIEIVMSGGGFYGGINPTIENRILISNNGNIIITHNSLYGNRTKKILYISKEKVKDLTGFIIKKGFFKMKDIYDCNPGDRECNDRKRLYPPAIPLTLSVTIDNIKKKVVVTVYEKSMQFIQKALRILLIKLML
jgi:hypothetical protein